MADPLIKNRVYDGEKRFTLGVNSLSNPWKINSGQYSWGYNVVTKGDEISTRPGYRSLLRLTSGNAQGCTLFRPSTGASYLVFAVGGSIFASQSPFTDAFQLNGLRFDAFVDHIVFKSAIQAKDLTGVRTPRNVLMMQDGRGRAAFWDGMEARHLDPNPAGPAETKIGLWMEWAGNRLWVGNGSQYWASDIFDPLHFTETIYLAGGGSFQTLDGRAITAMKRTSNSKQLLVFTDSNTDRVQAGVTDRSTWQDFPDFIATLFPGVGCGAGKSVIDIHGQISWIGADGSHFYSAVGESVQVAKNEASSHEMDRSYKNLSPILHRACGFCHLNYAGFAVPSGDIYNRHIWAMDTSASDLLIADQPLAWQGVWTGTRPVEFATGIVDGVARCFYISQDPDGPRIWEAFNGTQQDNGCDIECFLETRGHAFGETVNYKEMRYTEAYLQSLKGSLTFKVDYRTEFSCWKNLSDLVFAQDTCPVWDCTNMSASFQKQGRYVKSQEAQADPNPGGAPWVENIGISLQMRFRWTGQISILAYRVAADQFEETPTGDVTTGDLEAFSLDCCDPEPDYVSCTHDEPPYYYSASSPSDANLTL